MVRLLEELGLVRVKYWPNTDQYGPGCSTVLFYLTQEANRLISVLAGDPVD